VYLEILGITGSGKTTFTSKIKILCHGQKRINFVKIQTSLILKVFRDIRLLIYYVIFQHKIIFTTYVVICECIKRDDTLYMRLNLLRNFIIKQGEVYRVKLNGTISKIDILDEGSLHSLINIFCHYDNPPNLKALVSIQNNIIIPDAIIKINIKKDVMLYRTLKRSDPPWPNLRNSQWENMHTNMEMIYNHIIQYVIDRHPKTKIIIINGSNYKTGKVLQEIFSLTDAKYN
jgi:thymidylate kinase